MAGVPCLSGAWNEGGCVMQMEDEAKTKWCPYARFIAATNQNGDVVVVDNRAVEVIAARVPPCIGAACMAWRWGPIEEAGPNETVFVLARDHPTADPAYVGPTRKLRVPRGYCGLAGKP